MLVYVDSSTLLKRVLDEPEAESSRARLRQLAAGGQDLGSSSLAWIEVARALRQASSVTAVPADAFDVTLSGIAERPITQDVVSLARRIGPLTLRSLASIHLATAVLLDADLVLTHDQRLADAAATLDLRVESP